jgi:hypothetical protein
MNTPMVRPEIGQWYVRGDKGESFQVVGYDEHARTIEIQSFDGEIDEIDEATWASLPLERGEPPEDWTGPMDDIEKDDLGFSDTEMKPEEWNEPLQSIKGAGEAWEETVPEDERDPLGDGSSLEPFIAETPEADEKT